MPIGVMVGSLVTGVDREASEIVLTGGAPVSRGARL